MLKKPMTFLLFGIIVISMPLAFSACKEKADTPELSVAYDNVSYRRDRPTKEGYYAQFYSDELKEYDDWFYNAGEINEYTEAGELNKVQFIAAEVNGVPVMGLGYHIFMNSVGESHGSNTLKKIYTPGTIATILPGYFSGGNIDDISWFYCGKPINLYYCADEQFEVYVPNEEYLNFVELLPETALEDIPFYKANVSYRLNVHELPKQYQTEYYYVDYVEYGKSIENIPPEPTISGYKFGGWYTEPDCINQWDFTKAVPQPDEGEDFNELCLYAKWI